MQGFTKINILGDNPPPVVQIEKKPHPWKRMSGIVGVVLVLIILGIFFIAIPASDIYQQIQKTSAVARDVYTAAKNQDLENSKVKLAALKESLVETQSKIARLGWVGTIPLVGGYIRDAQHLVGAGIAGVEAGIISVDTLTPYADLLGLKGKSTFVAGSADDRIKTAVDTFDKIVPNVDVIAEKISLAEKELSQVQVEKYPEKVGSVSVRPRLSSIKSVFSETASLFVDAQPLLKQIPHLMGKGGTRKYLLIFQNDAELRATGGFITAYAIFKVENGKLQVEKADDIYKLDGAKRKNYPAPKSILTYHQGVNNLNLRDANLSPDFAESFKSFESMLYESIPEFPKIDGIIALDTNVLVEAIKILGEFNIYGKSFSSETDRRCDCPKAIYELEDYATRPVAYVREDRKDIIGVLMYQIMQRAMGVSPSQYWGRLFQMFLSEARQKHVLFYFHNEDAQKGIEALNFGGRIQQVSGDYLHINDVNFAGAKSNLFVIQKVKIDSQQNGSDVQRTIIISYKNPAPASNCNLEAGQLCLNGILRNWLRIYTPKGAKLVDFVGSEKETQTYEELGKTVFEGFFTVKPQGTSEVRVTYTIPSDVISAENSTLVQKQPGTKNPEYTILTNGRATEKFLLQTDKQVTLKL